MTMPVAPSPASLEDLQRIARQVRRDALEMITQAASGHPGGSLSEVELIVTLYSEVLRHNPQQPLWPDRDRFILSKGHGCPTLYATLAHFGYFDRSLYSGFRQLGSPLQGHPELGKLAGVEASTGSLGQGLSIGLGMALGARVRGKDHRIYVLMGDGEVNEGQVWEAAASASHHGTANLTAILDYNRIQLDGFCKDILDMEPMADKWRAFGWHVIEIDGHDLQAVRAAYTEARAVQDKPQIIIAHTIKGKGVSFMEGNPEFHGAPPSKEQLAQALSEIGEN